jgi:hypothetical protein
MRLLFPERGSALESTQGFGVLTLSRVSKHSNCPRFRSPERREAVRLFREPSQVGIGLASDVKLVDPNRSSFGCFLSLSHGSLEAVGEESVRWCALELHVVWSLLRTTRRLRWTDRWRKLRRRG